MRRVRKCDIVSIRVVVIVVHYQYAVRREKGKKILGAPSRRSHGNGEWQRAVSSARGRPPSRELPKNGAAGVVEYDESANLFLVRASLSESRAGELDGGWLGEVEAAAAASKSRTMLATPVIPPDPFLDVPSCFLCDYKAGAVQASQPCTVEATCKANWPARERSTEALLGRTLRGPPLGRGRRAREGVAKIKGAAKLLHAEDDLPSQSRGIGTGVTTHPHIDHPHLQWHFGPQKVGSEERPGEPWQGRRASNGQPCTFNDIM